MERSTNFTAMTMFKEWTLTIDHRTLETTSKNITASAKLELLQVITQTTSGSLQEVHKPEQTQTSWSVSFETNQLEEIAQKSGPIAFEVHDHEARLWHAFDCSDQDKTTWMSLTEPWKTTNHVLAYDMGDMGIMYRWYTATQTWIKDSKITIWSTQAEVIRHNPKDHSTRYITIEEAQEIEAYAIKGEQYPHPAESGKVVALGRTSGDEEIPMAA